MSVYFDGMGAFIDKVPVVLEIGNLFTKAGFANEAAPRCIIPSKTTELKHRYLSEIKSENDLYCLLVDFLQNLYTKYLLVNPRERKLVLVESVYAKTVWRNTLAKVFFFHFNVTDILFIPSHLTAVNALGCQTALVIDFGRDDITVIPVICGVTLLNNIQSIGLGTATFDRNLKILAVKYCMNKSKEKLRTILADKIVEDLRVSTCFVGKFDRSLQTAESSREALKLKPFDYFVDGENVLKFDGALREEAAEIWFQNNDPDGESLPLLILRVLKKIPIDYRKELTGSILLTGGPAMILGLKARLVRELTALRNNSSSLRHKFKFFEPPCCEVFLNWLGGTHYSSAESVALRGISREQFLKTEVVPDWCDKSLL